MEPAAELEAAMAVLGWSPPELAERLDVRVRTIQRWRAGASVVPERVLAWLRECRQARAAGTAMPEVPEGW
jgi:hypothetical protein